MSRRVFVIGTKTTPFIGKNHPDFIWKKHPDFGKRENPTIKEYIINVVRDVLKESNVPASQVQKAYVGNFAGELFVKQGHLGSAIAEADKDLMYVPSMRVEGACASGGLAFASGVDAIKAGTDIALVVGAEVQNTVSAREGGTFLARAADFERESKIDDFTFPAVFANRMKHYFKKYNVDHSAIDPISLKAYANGNKNPLAHMHAVKMTPEDVRTSANFLGNQELAPFLKLSDCSQVSDGAAALILASEAAVKKLGLKPEQLVEVLSCEVATGNLWRDAEDLTFMDTTHAAAQRAYKAAGLAGGKDVHVAEVHDCFSIAEVLMYEALGFCNRGEGTHLAKEGITHIDGKLPVNTGGGLIAFGHPVGATGVKQINEIVKQMKRKAGAYQVPNNNLEIGLCANMGGSDKTSVVTILKNM